ncbi:MAG: twin-arginine translocase TatA/TatE family subunit [Gammaproteobacteria bacterium]|nr:twin-arginine translocase TatA/TatE family subunit [Gammaproteobacteria bacterium]
MFEVGFWELALIFGLGLVVLGPEKLPKVAAQLGRYAGQARRMARTLTTQIRDEIEAEERRITASESKPVAAEPSYSRPGGDDLIPRAATERDKDPAPTPAEPAPTDGGDSPDERPATLDPIPGP